MIPSPYLADLIPQLLRVDGEIDASIFIHAADEVQIADHDLEDLVLHRLAFGGISFRIVGCRNLGQPLDLVRRFDTFLAVGEQPFPPARRRIVQL